MSSKCAGLQDQLLVPIYSGVLMPSGFQSNLLGEQVEGLSRLHAIRLRWSLFGPGTLP
jgi:hypothetical protein